MKLFFKSIKQCISFDEYIQNTLLTAKRIVEISPGKQRYTSAQFEMALIGFADLKTLKQEMDDDVEVELPKSLKRDWLVGFDWLDLAVHYGDEDAIEYFKKNMKDDVFLSFYRKYKEHYRSDCALQYHENISETHSLM
ncbi:hypothetical protein [Legionella parisiensis]|uniref:Uncharacterized protein n=1 Tax=Legionella parisiensis TaxID=45071 RepID=A0A1E5JM96_9GAMM|nr:hypothetical protein [Legionella parisiensis]KTD41303.1 hypothetical protein Lpar_2620 [Legionella parisiensis]OEH45463.1 hypothetical protein lpari_03514 [Legionella parisiensis]STX76396.1 Uncharacterised protein [Legionella parisiensis]